jgi:hypothetical protein
MWIIAFLWIISPYIYFVGVYAPPTSGMDLFWLAWLTPAYFPIVIYAYLVYHTIVTVTYYAISGSLILTCYELIKHRRWLETIHIVRRQTRGDNLH